MISSALLFNTKSEISFRRIKVICDDMFWSINKKGEKTYISNPPSKAVITKTVKFLDF